MSATTVAVPRTVSAAWIAGVLGGLALLAVAWLLPVNVKSLNPALLREAGRDTQSVSTFARELLELDRPGPAELVLETARAVNDPGAGAVGVIFEDYQKRHRDMIPWGGWDPALEPLLVGRTAASPADSTPVLRFLVTTQARDAMRKYLSVSRLPGVQALLKTGELTTTQRFVPAMRPGGQPLDAVILLTAYLWQTERLSPTLQREVRSLAEAAVATGQMGALEELYLDILTLGKRLNWVQLSELLRTASNPRTVAQFAHLTRVAPEHLPVIYTAALMTKSADGVARYLIAFGKPGAENLRLALASGEGAVRQLVARQAPVVHTSGMEFEFGAGFVLRHPELALFGKYAAFLLGVFLLLRSIDLRLFFPEEKRLPGAFPRMGSGVLASILTFIFFVFSEPFLLKAAAATEYQFRLIVPILGQAATTVAKPVSTNAPAMDIATILSITVFAALQVGMYVICLLKLADVDRQSLPPAMKLKLVENEENLFDGGLYVGIAGTATALVLQVLGVIEANLLAAYSSNLFGIICVALVKIRHVRNYKRKLILEAQQASVTA
ncbi:MAG: hypothetical protein KF715_16020 [Candidatus Didemnitutus sp.]|nr:hypothetical protein [Candidatus Didemnitutus sp.]